eukprot:gene19327-21251_t
MALASRISSCNINEQSCGVFHVNSPYSSDVYSVQLNNNGMPSCDCFDWKQHFLPCKHMFAVMLHMPNHSWEDMPVAYRDTSYFTLDPYCAVTNNTERDNEHDSSYKFKNISMPSNASDTEVEDVTSLPNPVPCDTTDLIIPSSFAKRSTGASCRDTLDQLKSMTFNIIRQESLEELQKKLQVLLNETKELTEKEDNLVIENHTTKSCNRSADKSCSEATAVKRAKQVAKKHHQPLPCEKPKRINSKRVGLKADNKRRQQDLFLNATTSEIELKTKKKKSAQPYKFSPKETAVQHINIEEYFDNEIDVEPYADTDEMSSPDMNQTHPRILDSDSDGDMVDSDLWMTIGGIQLKNDEKEILTSHDMWLNDLIINAAQHLLHVQFPHIGGFQDTICQRNLSMDIQNGEFIQILNKGGNHWITVTNIGVTNISSIRIFDSLGSSKFDFEMQKIIASLVHTNTEQIVVKIEDIQLQEDSNSCGMFAIANAVALCLTEDPREIQFDLSNLRSHLLHCLNKREMTGFPKLCKNRKPNLGKLVSFSVHCTCRMPLDPDDVWAVEKCSLCAT